VGAHWFGSVRLGTHWFGCVRLGAHWFGSVLLGTCWFGSVRLGAVQPSSDQNVSAVLQNLLVSETLYLFVGAFSATKIIQRPKKG
jgi:hypothetical protein